MMPTIASESPKADELSKPQMAARPQQKGTTALRFRQALFLSAAVFCLSPWGSPPVALSLGGVLALTLENPFHHIGRKSAKWLLQASVVLLGFGMNLRVVLTAGASGAAFAAATISATMLLGYLVGRWLRLRPNTAVLISAGTAICGGSAIAAVGSALDAEEGDMTVAMGTVFLLNSIALYLFPIVGHALGLSQRQFGMWAGVAIHDVSSVVGAAKTYGLDALQLAIAVKLARVLWIVPLVFGIVFVFGRNRRATLGNASFGFDAVEASSRKRARIQIPWFIGLFLLASVVRSVLPPVAAAAPWLSRTATTGLTLTLFLIGAGLSMTTLRTVGWKAFSLGLSLWLFASVSSLLVILRLK